MSIKNKLLVIKKQIQQLKLTILFLTAILFSNAVLAVDIANSPLFLNNGSTPNIMFVLDDSGSMDLEILTLPHHEAWLYDQDLDRSWAKGGTLSTKWSGGGSIQNLLEDGTWVSYAQLCEDKNADGICYNEHDYNADGDKNDSEQNGFIQNLTGHSSNTPPTSCTSHPSVNYKEHDRPRHWHYTGGTCTGGTGGGNLDARDYLPQPEQQASLSQPQQSILTKRTIATGSNSNFNLSNIIAKLTGSSDLEAALICTIGSISVHADTTSWHNTTNVYESNYSSDKNNCENNGGSWSATRHRDYNENTYKMSNSNHNKDTHDHADHSSVNRDEIKTYTQNTDYYGGSSIWVWDTSTAIGALDINGNDAIYTNTDRDKYFREKDNRYNNSNRDRYSYFYESTDNVFFNTNGAKGNNTKPERSCTQNELYRSAEACDHLENVNYPVGYPFRANAGQKATDEKLKGNENIMTLPGTVERQVRTVASGANYPWPSYVASSLPSLNVDFESLEWTSWQGGSGTPVNYPPTHSGHTSPKGTHHAMSRWDSWPILVDWRIRSSDFNVLYYNPVSNYKPWPGLTQAVFTDARSNPQPATTGYTDKRDLSRPHIALTSEVNVDYSPFQHQTEAGFVYEIWHDDAGYWWDFPEWTKDCNWRAGNYSGRGTIGIIDPATGHTVVADDMLCSTYSDVPNQEVDLWDTHQRVEVYTDKIVVQKVRRTPHILGEEAYAGDATKRFMSDTRISDKVIYTNANYSTHQNDVDCIAVLGEARAGESNAGQCRTLEQVKNNAANWFEYSRRRSFVAKGAIAHVMQDLDKLRYGLNVTSATGDISNLFVNIPSTPPYTAHNTSLVNSLYSYAWSQQGTPLRQALQRVGKYFKGELASPHDVNPITESCQRNFSIMLTDGYWNGADPVSVNNQDGDGYGNTLADVAKKYYDEDLDTSMNNNVPSVGTDTNSQQHLQTIGIAFGVKGKLDASGVWPALTLDASGGLEGSNWGNPHNTDQEKIDDLWHAAYNSRGSFYTATNPDELIQKLTSAVIDATAKKGSGSALSVNSNVLDVGSTRVYQTLFNSGDWTGDVKAYSLTISGTFNPTPIWSAQPLIDSASQAGTRKIITLNASDAGIPFIWSSLSAPSQQDMLRTRKGGTLESVAYGQAQLSYIRGHNDLDFRARAARLGDVVHSEALYVGKPNQYYLDADYLTFKGNKSGRQAMLYVGANDGMLHALDAATGAEKFAYIPRVLLPDLNELTPKAGDVPGFNHRYYVDGTPVSGDVKFSDANWHTVLVGGLRGGGKGIYALDVTDIPSDAEASADTIALWEFTSADDTDMGYSFSRPSVVRLNNGNFAAIFGNGYNSAAKKAVLYIVEFDTSSGFTNYYKFDTGVDAGSNGMSTATVIDTNGDLIADRVYAGDLRGNVWSIDISDSNSANWDFSYSSSMPETPLFTAINGDGDIQPITAPIVVSEHPYGPLAGYILNFGTGKYLGQTDNKSAGEDTQSMYGLWDYGVAGITRANLQSQEILAELVHTSSNTAVRVTSENGPIHWMNDDHLVGEPSWKAKVDQTGWYMDLKDTGGDNHGERVVSEMVVRGGAIILSTLLPAVDPCDGGGSGWTMTLNAATGARFNVSPFDINGDGLFTNDDFADLNGNGSADTAVSGVRSSSGIPSIPILLSVPGGGTVALSDHSSGGLAFDGTSTASSASCVVVGTGSCTVVPPTTAGGSATCAVTDPGASCYVGGHCAGGSCLGFNFSDTGRQSWIQLE